MRKIILLFIAIIIITSLKLTAQVSINNDGSNPDASAMLDVKSTDGGILIPRMTANQRDAINTPADGLLVFVTDDNNFYFYDGVSWDQVNGGISRTIAYASANGPFDPIDNGQILSRVLTIDKKKENTKLRISYTDNLRAYGGSNAARWEIRIDGNSCPNQPLVYDFYGAGINIHRSTTLVGYCSGISAGPHEIQVWVGPVPNSSNSDVYTGWNNSTWLIEAEEVN